MPKVKQKAVHEDEYQDIETNSVSSVLYGFVMVVAIIVAGAALLGGSLGQLGQRWSGTVDSFSRVAGLSLKRVELIGLEHVPNTARQVRIAVMIEPGENMFRADPFEIRRRVEATQLVKNVSVYRLWPDTIMIYANAVEPIALWQQGEDYAVIDSLGRIMPQIQAPATEALLKVMGDEVTESLPLLVASLQKAPGILEKVAYAQRISARRWDLILTTGARVQLPGDSALPTALARLARLEAQHALTQRKVERIDLRLAQGVYLKPISSIEIEEAA